MDTKRCPRCGKTKSRSEFYGYKTGPKAGKVHTYCKPCANVYTAERNRETPERREASLATTRRWRERLRERVIAAYGGQCSCCGESEPAFLEIDHIDGWGKQHRKEIGRGVVPLLQWLQRHEYPKKGIRLLCANCHSAITRRGRCPHRDPLKPL